MMEARDILDLAIEISLQGPEVILKDIQFLPPLRAKAANHLSKHIQGEVAPMVTSRTCVSHGITRMSADGGGKKNGMYFMTLHLDFLQRGSIQ